MFKNEEIYTMQQPDGLDNISLLGDVDIGDVDIDHFLQAPIPLQTYNEFVDEQKIYKPLQMIPVLPLGPPGRLNFAGDVNFTVEINAAHTKKKKYLYSHRLNRIYVDMGCNFSVGFRWDAARLRGEHVFVRATTVFEDLAQAEKRVERCHQHSHESSNAGAPSNVIMNVLRSARDLNASGVYYDGEPARADSWLSVLVQLPAPDDLAYVFACKNSCSSGINRRAICVLFTLEDHTGKVYGRQSVGARVCSCPRRDMLRDEEDAEVPRGKRPLAPARTAPAPATPAAPEPARGKRPRLEPRDDSVITLPSLEVVGVRTAVTGLEVMLSMMEQSRDARRDQPAPDLAACIAKLKALIDSMKAQNK